MNLVEANSRTGGGLARITTGSTEIHCIIIFQSQHVSKFNNRIQVDPNVKKQFTNMSQTKN